MNCINRLSRPARRVLTLVILVCALTSPLGFGAENARLYTSPIIPNRVADGFDFPVGGGDAIGYYTARGMTPNYHLGDDWNGRGGGNTDLGDPIYAIADGVVVYSYPYGSNWGEVIIIRHTYRDSAGKIDHVDSLYGHVQDRRVRIGDRVRRGQMIAEIGNNNGMYAAHLHLEIRKNINIGIQAWNFSKGYSNYERPREFIAANRPSAGADRSLRSLMAQAKAREANGGESLSLGAHKAPPVARTNQFAALFQNRTRLNLTAPKPLVGQSIPALAALQNRMGVAAKPAILASNTKAAAPVPVRIPVAAKLPAPEKPVVLAAAASSAPVRKASSSASAAKTIASKPKPAPQPERSEAVVASVRRQEAADEDDDKPGFFSRKGFKERAEDRLADNSSDMPYRYRTSRKVRR